MSDWLGIGLDLLMVFLTFGLTYYSYHLFARFFRGGMFENAFKVFVVAALFFGIAEVFHTLGGLLEINIPEIIHTISEVIFTLLLFLAFNLYYRAWTKMLKE